MIIKAQPPRRPTGIDAAWIPQRTLDWKENEDGSVFLLKEKFRNHFMKWLVQKAGKNQFFRIHLDRFGTRAWKLADGSRSIREIAEAMQTEFGDELSQAPERVNIFFGQLAGSRFVVFQRPDMNGNVG
ncbi:MAG: PqqD family protein [Candidatus Aminicenantes bacterium]|nr:PqqD family protein [Candidatus Aminicenantes bacterium]